MTPDPRAVLARHGLSPKKSWGQNFLVDRRVHARIAAAASATAADVVVEIGAGVGTLTAALLAATPAPLQVLAVERDPDMVAVLHAELGGDPRMKLLAEDAVAFDFAAAAGAAGRPVVVVGNLPYQITSALLFALVDAGPAIARAVVMVQREVAARVVAAPGSKIYGRLSVMIQQRMQTRLLFHVPAGAFHPRPKVVSSVLSLVPRAQPLALVRDQPMFARMVGEVFSTRRKMLRRSLADAFGEEQARMALAAAGVDGTRRPEELSITELAGLADALVVTGEQGR